MTRIIGFEGRLTDDVFVTYGAAAIELADNSIVNSFTGIKQPRQLLTADDVISYFKQPWIIDEALDDAQLVVVAVRRGISQWDDEFLPDAGRLGGCLGVKREKPFAFLLLRDRKAFRLYADETAWNCTEGVLGERWQSSDAEQIIRCALVLSPRDPTLLALRVFLSTDKDTSKRTAERLLQNAGHGAIARYRSFLRACEQPKETLYVLKYEDGDQTVGGLNLNVAVKQLEALEALTKRLRPYLKDSLPFIANDVDLPELRFQHLKAASAELGFGVLGQTLGDRVLRYLELEALGKLFRGEIPPELSRDPEFLRDLRAVMYLEGGATMRHQPIGSDSLEPVAIDPASEQERVFAEVTLHLLGFVEGFYREVRKAEVRFSTAHAESVSIEDDGDGGPPQGIEALRSGSGHFRPAIFVMLRRTYNTGRTRWYLRRMCPIVPGPFGYVDALPSSVVGRGVFSPDTKLSITTEGGQQYVGNFAVTAREVTLGAAKEWIDAWQTYSGPIELMSGDSTSSKWYPPSAIPEHSLKRVLVSLGDLTQPTSIDQIVQRLDDRYRVRIRTNNTWRTIHSRDDLFIVTDEGEISLSTKGQRWLTVMLRFDEQRLFSSSHSS